MRNANLFVAYVIGVAGVVLIISGVRGTTPLVTLGTLLKQGKLPDAVPGTPGPVPAVSGAPSGTKVTQLPTPGFQKPLP